MHNPPIRWKAALVTLVAAAAFTARASAGQMVVQAADGSVSVRASGATLGELLKRLGENSTFHKLVLDPKVEGRPVSITLENATVRQAVVQILNAADVNYALTADDDGRTIRLIAGEVAFVAETQRTVGRSDGAVATVDGGPQAIVEKLEKDLADRAAPSEAGQALAGETAPYNHAAAAFQLQQLEQALTAPAVRPPVGSVIELPFPGPDGQPLTTILQPKPAVVMLPFPTSVTNPAPAAR